MIKNHWHSILFFFSVRLSVKAPLLLDVLVRVFVFLIVCKNFNIFTMKLTNLFVPCFTDVTPKLVERCFIFAIKQKQAVQTVHSFHKLYQRINIYRKYRPLLCGFREGFRNIQDNWRMDKICSCSQLLSSSLIYYL